MDAINELAAMQNVDTQLKNSSDRIDSFTNNPKNSPDFKSLAEISPRDIDWLWENRIPKGCVTTLEGDGGIGKSYILIALACTLTTGRALPEQDPKPPINVMLLSLEDDPEAVLRKRVDANVGDPSKIFF